MRSPDVELATPNYLLEIARIPMILFMPTNGRLMIKRALSYDSL